MADVNSTATQNQTQQQPQTAPQNQPTQATGTQQQPQKETHEENNSGAEITIESLMAQLAQEKAANAKLKSDNDKLCTSEGNLRKQLRAKQTAEEQEAEAQKEAQRQADEERDSMRKELNHIKAVNAYKAISDEKAVESLIDAVSDADHNAIAQIIANECKKAVAEAEAKWLKDRPRVNHGQYSNMTAEQIMSITDRDERLRAIALNPEAFK